MNSSKGGIEHVVLVPVGEVDDVILAVIGEGLREVLGCSVSVGAPVPHPRDAYDRRRRQYLSDVILSRLKGLDLPADRWLGVADLDMFTPGLNFVFGLASIGGKAALIALPRLRQEFYGLPPDEALFHERAIKEAVHELGHTYGLGHCRNRQCVMSFSNSLWDVDRKGREFCARCRRKLP